MHSSNGWLSGLYVEIISGKSIEIFSEAGRLLIELAPYVFIGVLIGELLKFTSWTRKIYKVCNYFPTGSILLASLLGIVSPICTYGTIPIIIQLFRNKTPLPPLISFLAASSLMNPQLFILTWGGIGPGMALARLVTVLVFGVSLGIFLQKLPQKYVLSANVGNVISGDCDLSYGSRKQFDRRKFFRGAWKNLQFVGFFIVTGILLGAIIKVLVPGRWILVLFNPDAWFAVPLAALLGVPLYACGGGTIPLISSLMMSGMAKGSALAFFIVGPATRITPLMALLSIVRPAFIGIYVISIVVFALIAGFAYN